jgi:hypothetical protein
MNGFQQMQKNHTDAVAAAMQIDDSKTETVTVSQLKEGDVIVKLGKVDFPFPFTLSSVQPILTYGTVLKAKHGWFTPQPRPATEKVVRVVR